MANKLLLHKATAAEVDRFLQKPDQFLIIAGASGAGKTALALQIASQLLDQELALEHPSVIHLAIPPNKTEIPIEQVRGAISKLKLTTPGKRAIRRLLMIEEGYYLSEEAQNALLKTLEEPPADTQIIMTVDSAGNILPTITSRGRILQAKPVELAAAQKFFADRAKPEEIEKAWLLAEGLAGLTGALLSDSAEHELKLAVADAKSFISASKYERLIRAAEFTKNRRQLELMIEGLRKVIKAVQRQSILDGRKMNQRKMTAARKQLDELSDALHANVSPKTIYLKLSLNLGV